MKTQDGCVFIGKYEGTFICKIEGRFTQKSLWNANTAVQKCMDDPNVNSALLDITQCRYMDSTILGILARWAIAFGKQHETPPFLIGLEDNPLESIFQRMNLSTLFYIVEGQADAMKDLPMSRLLLSERYSTKKYAEYVLSAHETLAELSDDNAKEFAAVIQYLKADLSSQDG